MPFWLFLCVVFAANVAAFKCSRPQFSTLSPLVDERKKRCYAKSLLDDPLLLEPSSEPGKDHEVVVSSSPAFGLQRTLYRHKRNARAKKPRFKPGDAVYLISGPYRSSRGTILSTFRRAPGDPYLVNLVLDCRNERGIVRTKLAEYHGTRVTVWETQLSSRPLFAPYSPPPLSLEESYLTSFTATYSKSNSQNSSILGTFMSRIVNATSVNELRSIFDIVQRANLNEAILYHSFIVQLVRSLGGPYNFSEVQEFTADVLECLATSLKEGFSEAERESIPWTAWSLHALYKEHLVIDFHSYILIYEWIKRLLLTNKLTNLTQGEIALLATGFSSCSFQCRDVYHRLAMLYSYFPPHAVSSKHMATLAASLSREGIQHQGFTRLLCNAVKEQGLTFSPTTALFILEYLSKDSGVKREIKDELLACCSVAEFLKPNASPQGPLFRQAVRLARLSVSEMEELCIGLRSKSFDLPISEIMWAISALSYSGFNAEAQKLLIIRASHQLRRMKNKEMSNILYACRKLKECPSELLDSLEQYLRSLEEDYLFDPLTLRSMASILTKIPESRSGCQLLILKEIEKFINASLRLLQDSAIDEKGLRGIMVNITQCLEHITMVGYELKGMAQSAAKLLRKCIMHSPDRVKVLISIISIQAMCNSYFEDAANAARAMLSDPNKDLGEDAAAPLAELLLMVKATMEGIESISHVKERLALSCLPESPNNRKRGFPTVRDYPLMFSILVRSHLLEELGGVLNKLYMFAEENLASLSNADLVLMRDGLVALGAFDKKWLDLIDSIPKGIDAITAD